MFNYIVASRFNQKKKIMWEVYKKGFKAWLQLEKSLSENSVQAYLHDVKQPYCIENILFIN